MRVRRVAVALAALALVSACAPAPATAPRELTAPHVETRTAAPTDSATTPQVVVIAMENTTPQDAFGASYIASLAGKALVFTNFRAVSHPSLPNYLALTSGSTWSIRDDRYYALPSGRDLGAQLTTNNIPWRAYMEGMTSGCLNSPSPYAVKHNPFAYYGGACPANVVSFTQFAADLPGGLPRFTWITPDLCHDGHDCSAQTADAWLQTIVPLITASPSWQRNGVLMIVWDEGTGPQPDETPMVVLTSGGRAGTVGTRTDAYSVLATIQELLGLPKLGAAAQATSFTYLLD
jgi:hypothetical protein